ncbi:hypothetical protein FBU30_005980 [Linnemannia zychae]|nr:hypothetical protein FBU30_005980 [Linnemannia zychae]
MARDSGASVLFPTLVILIECFGCDPSLEIDHFSLLDLVSGDFQSVDMKTHMNEKQNDRNDKVRNEISASRRSLGTSLDVCNSERRQTNKSKTNRHHGKADVDNYPKKEYFKEQEYTEYTKMVARTMAEIKDSLTWLDRSSGQKTELLITEGSSHETTKISKTPPSFRIAAHMQQEMMPIAHELWLQTIMGFWVDAIIKVEAVAPVLQPYSYSKESFMLWIKTQESLHNAFESMSTNSDVFWTNEDGHSRAEPKNTVLGVQWSIDSTGTCVQFSVS